MPSLKQATQPRDTSNMEQLTNSSSRIPRPLPPLPTSADPEFNSTSLAPIPSVLGTEVDASRQFYRQGVSQVRMMPLPATSSPAIAAVAKSAAVAAVVESGPLFSTNNVPNPVQDSLNITGSGVSYGPGKGQVQIASSGTGDGLTHGTTPWETDPSSVIMVDDFNSGNATSGSIGSLNWTSLLLSSAFVGLTSSGFPNSGSVYCNSAVTSNGGVVLTPVNAGALISSVRVPVGFPITYNPGWDCSFVFRWPTFSVSPATTTFTKARLYLGFAVYAAANSAKRPAKFCGLRFDTDPGVSFAVASVANTSGGTTVYTGTFTGGGSNLFAGMKFKVSGFTNAGNNGTFFCQANSTTTLTLVNTGGISESASATAATPAISDSTYVFECVQNGIDGNNVQGTTYTTAISPDRNWHRFRMRSVVQGQILFSLDGGTEQMLSISTDTFPSGYTSGGVDLTVTGNSVATGNTLIQNAATVSWFLAPSWQTPSVLAGCTSTAAVLNGTYNISNASSAVSGGPAYQTSGVNSSATQTSTGITFTWYNAFYPLILFGNDSQSSPGAKILEVDFFGFAYNPGLATDFAQTTDPTKSRFFAAQT